MHRIRRFWEKTKENVQAFLIFVSVASVIVFGFLLSVFMAVLPFLAGLGFLFAVVWVAAKAFRMAWGG